MCIDPSDEHLYIDEMYKEANEYQIKFETD